MGAVAPRPGDGGDQLACDVRFLAENEDRSGQGGDELLGDFALKVIQDLTDRKQAACTVSYLAVFKRRHRPGSPRAKQLRSPDRRAPAALLCINCTNFNVSTIRNQFDLGTFQRLTV